MALHSHFTFRPLRATLIWGASAAAILLISLLLASCASPAAGSWWIKIVALAGSDELSAMIPFQVARDGTFSGEGTVHVIRTVPSQTGFQLCEEQWLLPSRVVMTGRYLGKLIDMSFLEPTPASGWVPPRKGLDIDSIHVDPITEATVVTVQLFCGGQPVPDSQGAMTSTHTLGEISRLGPRLSFMAEYLYLYPDLMNNSWAAEEADENAAYQSSGYDSRVEIEAIDGASTDAAGFHLELHSGSPPATAQP